MSVWISASAVTPAPQQEWGISSAKASWLTGAVQVGSVVGALASAVLNLADRVSARLLIAGSALGVATTNAATSGRSVGCAPQRRDTRHPADEWILAALARALGGS